MKIANILKCFIEIKHLFKMLECSTDLIFTLFPMNLSDAALVLEINKISKSGRFSSSSCDSNIISSRIWTKVLQRLPTFV